MPTNTVGAALLLLLINVTLFPFLWGHLTLRDSVMVPSLYKSGSRSPATNAPVTPREVDPGAPAWQTEPWFALTHDIVTTEKTLPLWNPYSAFGAPLAANMQSQVYSPFAWIAIASKQPRAYAAFVAARLYAGGVFAFLFLRLFVGFWPALAGGAAFMYTGYFWEFVTMPEVSAEVCLPGLLYVMERLLRRPTFAACALFALAVVGGMPEALALGLGTAYAYGAVRLLSEPSLRASIRRSAPALCAATILGAGISAVQLIPFFEYVPLSQNLHSGNIFGVTYDAFSIDAVATYLAPLMQGPPLNDIFSGFAGYTQIRGSFGCATVFFAFVAIVHRFRDALSRRGTSLPIFFFSALALVCLAKRFGITGVNWLGTLPLMRLIIFPKYDEALLACAVAVLTGFGIAQIQQRRVSFLECAIAAAVPLAVLTVAAGAHATAFAALTTNRSYYTGSLLCALLFLAAALAAALIACSGRVHPAAIAAFAVLLVAGEAHAGYIVPMFYAIDREPDVADDTLGGAPYVSFLKANIRDGERMVASDELLFPNWSAAFAIRDVRALDALYARRYLPFVAAFPAPGAAANQIAAYNYVGMAAAELQSPQSRRFLQLASVRFVASTKALGLGYRTVFHGDAVTISQFMNPLPRISLYRHIVLARDAAAALSLLVAPGFDPVSEAIVESDGTARGLASFADAAPAPVVGGRLLVDRSRSVVASFETQTSAIAVLNDTFYPGWTARLDGHAVPILQANYLFRGVVVAPGKHVLTFTYDPPSFVIGAIVSLVSLGIAAALSCAGRRPNYRALDQESLS